MSPELTGYLAAYAAVTASVAFLMALIALNRPPVVNVNQSLDNWGAVSPDDDEIDEEDDDSDSADLDDPNWWKKGKPEKGMDS